MARKCKIEYTEEVLDDIEKMLYEYDDIKDVIRVFNEKYNTDLTYTGFKTMINNRMGDKYRKYKEYVKERKDNEKKGNRLRVIHKYKMLLEEYNDIGEDEFIAKHNDLCMKNVKMNWTRYGFDYSEGEDKRMKVDKGGTIIIDGIDVDYDKTKNDINSLLGI